MSYMKEIFNVITDKKLTDFFNKEGLWNEDIKNEYLDGEKETFEVVKGDYKTIIECKFSKNGTLIHVEAKSRLVPQKIEEQIKKLETLRDEAVSKKDYLAAHNFQRDIEDKKKLL